MQANTHTDTGDTVFAPDTEIRIEKITCPITMEEIDEGNVFVHANYSFDAFALYTYLTKSVFFVNPVNRVPFTIEDLTLLEDKMKQLCGADCIVSRSDSSSDCGRKTPSESDEEISMVDTDIDSDLPSSLVELRLVPSPIDARIRMEVNLNMNGYESSSSESSLSVDGDTEVETDNDIAYFDDNSDEIRQEDLPPRRCYYSIVEMFQDKHRATKMKADLDLVQYLNYDGVDLINQMVGLLCDENFHQMVWEQTFPTVLDTLSGIIRDRSVPSDSNVDVEVVYSDCWETYRSRVLKLLNRRYTEVVRDLKCIDISEAEACVKSHISLVESNADLNTERKSLVVTSLQDHLKAMYT
jgi:hypothetical protein